MSVTLHKNPTVSFCVKCFNQARYIGAAVDGALLQDYRPIEIVIGDDASSDESVDVIRERLSAFGYMIPRSIERDDASIVERYGNDGRTVVLVLNQKNAGNLGNWQKVCSVAKGELFVKADGDDVSLPQRTSRVVEEWQKAGPKCGVLFHNAFKINEEGRVIGDASKDVFVRRLPLGAVMACVSACAREFDSTVGGAVQDDAVYAHRAELLGFSVCRFNECLVNYRIGTGESTVGQSYTMSIYDSIRRAIRTNKVLVSDLEYVSCRLPVEEYANRLAVLKSQGQKMNDELPMWESPSFLVRVRSFLHLHRHIVCSKVFLVHLILLVPHRYSKPLLDWIYKRFFSL